MYGKELRLYHNLDFFLQKGENAEDALLRLDRESGKTKNRHSALSLLISGVELFIAYSFAVQQYRLGTFNLASFVLLVSSLQLFTQGVSLLLSILPDLAELTQYYLDYEQYMGKEPPSHDGEREICCALPAYAIEFRNVSFRYPNSEVYALRDVNLTVSSGRTLAVVGENGSGKSTLVKLLCRLYEPSEGEILFQGTPIQMIDRACYTRILAAVFQDFKLHAFSLRENIAFLNQDDVLILSLLQAQGQMKLLGENGLDTYVGKTLSDDGRDYSGGERQQLAYIRALFKAANDRGLPAPLYLLDEPTAALDPIAELDYFQSMKRLGEGPSAAVYVTHRMASAKFADSILVLDGGKVVEEGSFGELMQRNGKFAEMFRLQARWYEQPASGWPTV